MRGSYTTIHSAIVDDPEFKRLGPAARLTWYTLRLVLGASGIDILRAHVAALMDMTSYPEDVVRTALAELEAGDWLVRDGDVLWLRNALKFNPHVGTTNEKHVLSLQKHLSGLPRLPIVAKFASYYEIPCPFDTLSDTLSVPHTKQEVRDKKKEIRDRKKEEGGDSQPPSLVDWLGEYAGCASDMDTLTAKSLRQLYGPSGTQEGLWEDIAPERRPPIMATAIIAWCAKGEAKLNTRFFAGILRREVEAAIAADRKRTEQQRDTDSAQELLSAASALDATEVARLTREGSDAILRATTAREWYDQQPPNVQREVDAIASVGLSRFGKRPPRAIVQQALADAVDVYRSRAA